MQSVPIDTCFNPIRVSHGDGFIYVPCGSCPACKKSFHSRWRNRLEHAINSHSTTLFISLTYSNEHLPLCEIDPDTNEILSITHTCFNRGTSYTYKRVELLDKYTSEDLEFTHLLTDNDYNDLPHFVASRHNNNCVFDEKPRFAICLRKDVQDFLKRLRISLSRCPEVVGRDTSFTYFICSEYGPDTFRPHYHGLLFFNDSFVASLCHSRLVHDSWRKSNLTEDARAKECEIVSFGSGSAQYTSKYVTCHDVLPSFLCNKYFKPFHVSSHSIPVGSTCLPFSAVAYTVRETDLLYPKVFKDKDSNEFVTIRVPYPPTFWSRYFPKFLFHGNLSVSILSELYTRIFTLPLYSAIPNRVKEFNSFFGVGSIKHTSEKRYYYHCDEVSRIWIKLGAVRSFDRHPVKMYSGFDELHRVTYSDVFPTLLKHPEFIDLFLFGIPQNRTVVNKILKLRVAALHSDDNWCYSAQDYLRYFNLYSSKCFSNTLSKFYDNFISNNPDCVFSPKVISEYYPTFYKSLPKHISAFSQFYYEKVENILFYNFGFNVEQLYDDSGNLLTFDFYHSPAYLYYRYMVSLYYIDFATKRKSNYDKYGCGEKSP